MKKVLPDRSSGFCFFPKLFLSFAWFLFLGGGAWVQAQNVPGFDATTMLQNLETMKNTQKQARNRILTEAYNKAKDAASTPNGAWNLYLEAVRTERYSGKTGGATEFQEWRKKNGDKLRTPEALKALQFQLRYLGLTLRKIYEESLSADSPLMHDLNTYIRDLGAEDANFAKAFADKDQKEAEGFLNKEIGSSIFINYLGLTGQLGGISEWEMTPGNIAGIMDKTLRPALRKTKNESLLQTWDWQIDLERKHAQADKLSSSKEKFEQQRLPSLQWSRAKEYIALDHPQQAATAMFAVIKAYPFHPDLEKWIGELETLLNGMKSE